MNLVSKGAVRAVVALGVLCTEPAFGAERDKAGFVAHSVPSRMETGRSYSASVRVQNDGDVPWTRSQGYRLRCQDPKTKYLWSTVKLDKGKEVQPGGAQTFEFSVRPPKWAGRYAFRCRIYRGDSLVQGTMKAVVVRVPRQDRARFVNQKIPVAMNQGDKYELVLRFKNEGNTVWGPNNYQLRSRIPDVWGANRVSASGTVRPQEVGTFRFQVTAPGTGGLHEQQWQMLGDSGFFGNRSPKKEVCVQPGEGEQPPVVRIIAPKPGAKIPGMVEVTGEAQDDGAVVRVEVWWRSEERLVAQGREQWKRNLDLKALCGQQATVYIYAQAVDCGGKSSKVASVQTYVWECDEG